MHQMKIVADESDMANNGSLDNMPNNVLLRIFGHLLPKKAPDDYFTRQDFHAVRSQLSLVSKRFYGLCDQMSMFTRVCYDGLFTKAKFESFCQFATSKSSVADVPRIGSTKKFWIKLRCFGSNLVEFCENFTLTNLIVKDLFAAAAQLSHLQVTVCPLDSEIKKGLVFGGKMPLCQAFFSTLAAAQPPVLQSLKSFHFDSSSNIKLAEQFTMCSVALHGCKGLESLKWLGEVDALDKDWLREYNSVGGPLRELAVTIFGKQSHVSELAKVVRDHCPHLESLEIQNRSTRRAVEGFLTDLCAEKTEATFDPTSTKKKKLDETGANKDGKATATEKSPSLPTFQSSIKCLHIDFNFLTIDVSRRILIESLMKFPNLKSLQVTGAHVAYINDIRAALPSMDVVNTGMPPPRTMNDCDGDSDGECEDCNCRIDVSGLDPGDISDDDEYMLDFYARATEPVVWDEELGDWVGPGC